jgi:hypothetical protein
VKTSYLTICRIIFILGNTKKSGRNGSGNGEVVEGHELNVLPRNLELIMNAV